MGKTLAHYVHSILSVYMSVYRLLILESVLNHTIRFSAH